MGAQHGLLDVVKGNLHQLGRADARGLTALMCAVWGGHAACARFLLPELGRRGQFGNCALAHSVRRVDPECAGLLLAESGLADDAGQTPFACSVDLLGAHADARLRVARLLLFCAPPSSPPALSRILAFMKCVPEPSPEKSRFTRQLLQYEAGLCGNMRHPVLLKLVSQDPLLRRVTQ